MPTTLTSDAAIAGMPANSHQSVYLARGLSMYQLAGLKGRTVALNAGKPTEDEAIAQVAENPSEDIVEFTAIRRIAESFGQNGYVIVVKIRRMYLTRGSVAEAGWVAYKRAPFEIVEETRGSKNAKKKKGGIWSCLPW